jgi:hypothetical protein
MNHFLASDDKYRDLIYDDDYWSHRISKRNSPNDYRFGRTPGKGTPGKGTPGKGTLGKRARGKHVRAHARAALGRLNGYLKNMIEAIANSKLRRMERELELRGIRCDRLNSSPSALRSRPTELSRGSK